MELAEVKRCRPGEPGDGATGWLTCALASPPPPTRRGVELALMLRSMLGALPLTMFKPGTAVVAIIGGVLNWSPMRALTTY